MKRQLGYEVGDQSTTSHLAKRLRVADVAEADSLQPQDDPTLMMYEAQFMPNGEGKVFVDVITAERGRAGKKRRIVLREEFHRIVAVKYSTQNAQLGEVWGVDAVPVDERGAVATEHRTCTVATCGLYCCAHVKSRSLVFYGLQDSTTVDESVAEMVADYETRFGVPNSIIG